MYGASGGVRAHRSSSMEMTLRWAARSKKYFEEHKQEVPCFHAD